MAKKQLFVSAAILFLMVFAVQGQKIQTSSFGKGLNFFAVDSSMSVQIHFRMQNMYSGEYDLQGEEFESEFMVRRSRLKFDGFAFSPRLKYKAELGLSGSDISTNREDGMGSGSSRLILDAVLKYDFQKHWSLWMGQTKLPGNRERVVSSADLQFVDRSQVNGRFNIDRDMGLQLHGSYTLGKVVVQPKFAFSQGEGRDITAENVGGFCYTGRLDVLPFGEFEGKKDDYMLADIQRQTKPKLAIGFTGNLNQGAARQQGQLGSFVYDSTGVYAENDLLHVEVDAHFKYKGFSSLTEIATTSAGSKIEGLSSQYATGSGASTQAGYIFKNNLEVAGRYTRVLPDDEDFSSIKDSEEWTLAVSRYFVGHSLKVQSDVSWIVTDGSDEAVRVRAQIEMQF